MKMTRSSLMICFFISIWACGPRSLNKATMPDATAKGDKNHQVRHKKETKPQNSKIDRAECARIEAEIIKQKNAIVELGPPTCTFSEMTLHEMTNELTLLKQRYVDLGCN